MSSAWQNTSNPFDVDGIGGAQALDALILINSINLHGPRFLPAPPADSGNPPPFLDVTGDEWITPEDVLQVVNHLNATASVAVMAGESELAPALAVRRTAAPAAGLSAESTVAAVDTLLATWAAVPQQQAGTGATVRRAKVEDHPTHSQTCFRLSPTNGRDGTWHLRRRRTGR